MIPIYGWVNYRVRVEKSSKSETNKTTYVLSILAKARTRALKRRRTDEESLPQEPAEAESSFSDEASGGSSSEDPREKRRRQRAHGLAPKGTRAPTGNTKGKRVKKTPDQVAEEKFRLQEKKAATTAAKKVKECISGLRTAASHHLILDVPAEVLQPVQQRVKALQVLERACLQAAQGKAAEWKGEYEQVPWPTIKQEQAALKKKLGKLEKAF